MQAGVLGNPEPAPPALLAPAPEEQAQRVPAAGPGLRFAHIDGPAVTGNVHLLTSAVLASITDCTGVTMQ